MLVCVDVHYESRGARTACLGFAVWTAADSCSEHVFDSQLEIAAYESGNFYKRELPLIIEALHKLPHPIETLIIDGHVWLSPDRPGLGAHLFEALQQRIPVVGVAKRRFHESAARVVLRGQSQNPLYVTAAGVDVELAAQRVREMHGAHRLPTLLKRVDSLARGRVSPLVAAV